MIEFVHSYISIYIWTKKLKKISNIKIKMFGVGAMDEYSYINKLLYKLAFKNIDTIFVRDAYSQDALERIFKIKSYLTYDVAFALDMFEPYKNNNIIDKSSKTKKTNYLLGTTSYARYLKYNSELNEEQYYEFWLNYAKKLDQGNNLKLFYTTPEDLNDAINLKKCIKTNIKKT